MSPQSNFDGRKAPKAPKAFVCGDPIAHSMSPKIHGHWLKQHKLSGTYVPQLVTSEKLKEFIGQLGANGYCGGNVTIPHKQAVMALVDECDEACETIGAANTIWFENNKLLATNTDHLGFAKNLDQWAPDWSTNSDQKTALVLGAGGASRAILFALLQRGFSKIHLFNRSVDKAETLAETLGNRVSPGTMTSTLDLMSSADLLVNTTSLGMTGHRDHENALFESMADLPNSALVTDIVYAPLETALLRHARILNRSVVDGLGMLLHQAAPGFEKWFGLLPQVDKPLRDMVVGLLQEKNK